MNRALIAQSYEPQLKLVGDSTCNDVLFLKKSLRALGRSSILDCGEGGTTLRFLAFRVSRIPGQFLLKGTPRLLSRPQKEIQVILNQLGVQVNFEKQGVRIQSQGWQNPGRPIKVHAKDSSQFLSALFLNAWDLDFDLRIQLVGKVTSLGYFKMTLKLLKELGFKYSRRGEIFRISREQKIKAKKLNVEPDLSSLFSVASLAAISGGARFKDFPQNSLQPDRAFVGIFKKMGVACTLQGSTLSVQAAPKLKAVKVNLQDSPDLFPVLAVLCSFAAGKSVLFGAPQLAFKESDRIQKTQELLKKSGVVCKVRKDGIEIHGLSGSSKTRTFRFDPDQDHRLAMAAALLKYYGQDIKISDPDVVQKSFPEFWDYVGVHP